MILTSPESETINPEHAPSVMLWISQSDGDCEWFNAGWLAFTGDTLEQACAEGWLARVHPLDLARCQAAFAQAAADGQRLTIECRLRRHDGEYCTVLTQAEPRFSQQGSFAGFVASCMAIQTHTTVKPEPVKQNAASRPQQTQSGAGADTSETLIRLYETILSATPDLIYNFDFSEPEPRFSYANEGLVQMLGRPAEQIIGKTLRELGYEDWHAEMHHREIDTVRTTKKPIRGEVAFSGTFGRRIYDYIFAPVFDSQGEVVAVAGTTRDVTESHNTQEILKKHKEALQAADARKDEFLAMLAHELRNPLSPISAATQIMALSNYEATHVRTSSQIIERQVKHMVGLVDDLLDVSRVTRGLVDIEKVPQDMNAIIASSLEQVRPLIESKQHALEVVLTSEAAMVLGDHKRLVQIVSNLLNNAAKYTPNGGQIKLAMTVENNAVILEVTDNGVGILPDEQEVIFELFAQTKRSSDRSQGGLGVGLALVKSILRLHEGTIRCTSAGIGMGSQFTMSLPLWKEKVALPSQEAAAAQIQTDSVCILVVDDNVDAATSLASLIELYGHEVMIEHDSLQALVRIDEKRPMICVLDIGLPKMNGYELAQHIRANPLMANATLIAVTGYGQESDIRQAFQSGFDHHMVKPVDCDALMSVINDAAHKLLKRTAD